MKTIYTKMIIGMLLTSMLVSCSDKFLEEEPKDFLTSSNAFLEPVGFEAAVANLHKNVRDIFTGADGTNPHVLLGLGADFAGFGENFVSGARMNYEAISSTDGLSAYFWELMYKNIKNANVIITRAENPAILWESDTQKDELVAEAKFFRAYAYRILVQLFGGVPIIDYEVESNANDLVRASKENVYAFIIADLLSATENLRETEQQSGRITKAAAYHLLAEAYIAIEQWPNAIAAASAVIDNPNYELMTSRFGTRSVETGDVYWDLFRRGNQNRSSGNKETIWAMQIEYETPGGGIETGASGFTMERAWGCRYWSLKDPAGKSGFEVGDEYGRPVGWCTLTDYVAYDIWDIDNDGNYDNDMRNSSNNIRRFERGDFIYNNPSSAYFGTPALLSTVEKEAPRYWFPYFMKNTTPNNHPGGVFNTGRIWRDYYVMRLAETYLLRAEAYLGAGELGLAAADINKVRERANANPISGSDVDINFILDERARELTMEELRTLTLMRLGLMYERTRDLNKWSGTTIADYNNLWPIPQREIDLNTGAELTQNPGY
ncbi:RagB/SusD family nutrient uptake outer membrane protein [Confluentibacter flavum]|uniref:RagB/SusD family nutrient uptake outer membrane protein n=1 Tax=Confluentibacter flavum TaxID=1909700 RepID=A0A2N3HH89_9FLAO|nr:RagB/SusD family nutrient uptake outer membrane protein [Confluentibacter flavum]PKQ44168.1 RagB/SusD family nutrient uptake outer membrane protein [Confluentibacter flavum]